MRTKKVFRPFRFGRRHVTGWEYWEDEHGVPILHTLRIRRVPAVTGPGIIVMRNPARGEDK